MKKYLTALYNYIYKILYKIFCLMPVSANQCVFCSMDNKDAFENLLPVKKELQETSPCFSCFGKINNLYTAVRTARKLAGARFIFLNAAYTYTSIVKLRKETTVIQLWHAAGAFKKFGMHTITGNSYEIKKQKTIHGYYDYVIVSSNAVIDTYAEAFQMDKSHILPLGLPRIQKLIEKNTKRHELKEWLCCKYDKLWYKKIILYAPTFRENKGKRDYTPSLEIKDFASQLPDEYILALKLHPRSPKSSVKYPANVIDFTRLPYDIVLTCSDILITDYSSTVFDFSALNKPVFFYTPDEIMFNRGLYFSPKKKYPEITFSDYYELANTIILIHKDTNYYKRVSTHSDNIKNEYIQNTTNSVNTIKNFITSLATQKETGA